MARGRRRDVKGKLPVRDPPYRPGPECEYQDAPAAEGETQEAREAGVNLSPGAKDIVRYLEILRDHDWNEGKEEETPNSTTENVAALLQRRGDTIQPACDRCQQVGGVFRSCVAAPAFRGAAFRQRSCANCIWDGKERSCSLRRGYTTLKPASIGHLLGNRWLRAAIAEEAETEVTDEERAGQRVERVVQGLDDPRPTNEPVRPDTFFGAFLPDRAFARVGVNQRGPRCFFDGDELKFPLSRDIWEDPRRLVATRADLAHFVSIVDARLFELGRGGDDDYLFWRQEADRMPALYNPPPPASDASSDAASYPGGPPPPGPAPPGPPAPRRPARLETAPEAGPAGSESPPSPPAGYLQHLDYPAPQPGPAEIRHTQNNPEPGPRYYPDPAYGRYQPPAGHRRDPSGYGILHAPTVRNLRPHSDTRRDYAVHPPAPAPDIQPGDPRLPAPILPLYAYPNYNNRHHLPHDPYPAVDAIGEPTFEEDPTHGLPQIDAPPPGVRYDVHNGYDPYPPPPYTARPTSHRIRTPTPVPVLGRLRSSRRLASRLDHSDSYATPSQAEAVSSDDLRTQRQIFPDQGRERLLAQGSRVASPFPVVPARRSYSDVVEETPLEEAPESGRRLRRRYSEADEDDQDSVRRGPSSE
ncbi:hypothetical protein BDW62DRAFT_203992 [Aspergillus aurantiobrunneus]